MKDKTKSKNLSTNTNTGTGTGLIGVFKEVFRGFNPDDAQDQSVSYEVGNIGYTSMLNNVDQNNPLEKQKFSSGTDADWLQEKILPNDRMMKYSIFQQMAKTELVTACLQMHVSHALSPDMATGNIITIDSDNDEFKPLAAEIMSDIGNLINDRVGQWAMLMAIYGAHYIRPIGVDGVGITDIESNYYTLAKHIKEYQRGDLLCGFTSEYLKIKEGEDVRLAEPWSLVALKIPYWLPDIENEPIQTSGEQYSLYTDIHRRKPLENQNYGTSFLDAAYPAWSELNESIKGLRGARYNASRQDRFITVGMEGLDPVSASKYLNNVGTQMRKDMENEALLAKKRGIMPTVWNRFLPVMSGKGGVTVDTQSTSPDINGIEDVLFTLKRFCSAMGIDPSMIGWSDMMNGGLGEGGWARTSIIAALRANWIRQGVRDAVNRLIEIHLAYKLKKAFPRKTSPFVIRFHSINTALAIEKADELQSKVDFQTAVTTLLDMIGNGSINGSKTFKEIVMGQVGFSEAQVETILKELESNPPQDPMLESVNDLDERLNKIVHQHINEILSE